jgi:hypothetical protein
MLNRLIALTPIAPLPPAMVLKSGSFIFTDVVNHATRQYCRTHDTKTLAEVKADMNSNEDSIL